MSGKKPPRKTRKKNQKRPGPERRTPQGSQEPLGPLRPPSRESKATRNRPVLVPFCNIFLNHGLDRFRSPLGADLGRILGCKLNRNRSKIGLKTDHCTKTRSFNFTHKNQYFFNVCWFPRKSKTAENRSRNDIKLRWPSSTQQ